MSSAKRDSTGTEYKTLQHNEESNSFRTISTSSPVSENLKEVRFVIFRPVNLI